MAEAIKIKVDLQALEALTKRYPEASAKAREGRLTEALLLLDAEIALQAGLRRRRRCRPQARARMPRLLLADEDKGFARR